MAPEAACTRIPGGDRQHVRRQRSVGMGAERRVDPGTAAERGVDPARSERTRLFVYGTLTPDGGAWELLEPWTVGAAEPDAVPGTLYDTGRGYPAATFDPASTGLVRGVVVALDASRSEAALIALDRYEAHEYARIVVRTVSGVLAVTYVVAVGRASGAGPAAAAAPPAS